MRWDGSLHREQMRDRVNRMGKLTPLVIEVMMDHPTTLWGDGGALVCSEAGRREGPGAG
jgi:hypothetical protein